VRPCAVDAGRSRSTQQDLANFSLWIVDHSALIVEDHRLRSNRVRRFPGQAGLACVTEDEVCERLRALRADHSAWRSAQDTGQFSLAGAQPKTALLFERKRWGVLSGRVPTTHILKPPTGEWDGHAENEHFSLR
jgi:hypothetical protein